MVDQNSPEPAKKPTEDKEPIKIGITLPTNAYFMSGVREFTLSIIKNMTQLSDQWAYRFQSVVDELCNNASEFGSAPKSDITVSFVQTPGVSIDVIVEDRGTGPKTSKAADLQKLIDERKKPGYVFNGIRGRGLAKIVSEWTDDLKIEDREGGGLKITATKRLDIAEDKQQTAPGQAQQAGAVSPTDPTHVTLN